MITLNGQEQLLVVPVAPDGQLSPFTEITTTAQIAALGGSSGGGNITQQQIVSSGSSYTTVLTGIFIGWNSNSGASKTTTIPTSTGSLKYIVVSDLYGDAGSNHVTITPVSGSILGPSVLNVNYASITLIDTNSGWCSV